MQYLNTKFLLFISKPWLNNNAFIKGKGNVLCLWIYNLTSSRFSYGRIHIHLDSGKRKKVADSNEIIVGVPAVLYRCISIAELMTTEKYNFYSLRISLSSKREGVLRSKCCPSTGISNSNYFMTFNKLNLAQKNSDNVKRDRFYVNFFLSVIID